MVDRDMVERGRTSLSDFKKLFRGGAPLLDLLESGIPFLQRDRHGPRHRLPRFPGQGMG